MALQKVWTSKSVLNRCLQEMVAQSHFLRVSSLHTTTTQHNSNKTSIVRSSRQKYERLYPLLLVQPDGSTINIRYKEPKRILMVSILELKTKIGLSVFAVFGYSGILHLNANQIVRLIVRIWYCIPSSDACGHQYTLRGRKEN
uniref:39S ribosomal protein L55, mitochondrial n=1 Tax=Oncorhynchus kisutch TaxID=8019 RepID=A0A8C7N6U7_ONCKI